MIARTGLRVWHVAVVCVTTGVVMWVLLRWWVGRGHALPASSWLSALVLVMLAALVVAAAMPVRRLVRGQPVTNLGALRAARVLVLAQAAALTGAMVAGSYAAGAIVLLPMADIPSQLSNLWVAVGCAAAGVVLAAAGLAAQWMCRLGDDDEARRTGIPEEPEL